MRWLVGQGPQQVQEVGCHELQDEPGLLLYDPGAPCVRPDHHHHHQLDHDHQQLVHDHQHDLD
jgi:hypothetical protein